MIRALVVYESMFGGTHRLAEAIAEGMRTRVDVSLVGVGEGASRVESDLLIVGAPTHAGGLSSPDTRDEAVEWSADPERHLVLDRGARGIGIREWLDDLQKPIPFFAAFDTRANAARIMTGSAATHIDRKLRKLGGIALVDSTSFLVHENDVLDGEFARAVQWGARLAAAAAESSSQGGDRASRA
jgi:hypothetical protein